MRIVQQRQNFSKYSLPSKDKRYFLDVFVDEHHDSRNAFGVVSSRSTHIHGAGICQVRMRIVGFETHSRAFKIYSTEERSMAELRHS